MSARELSGSISRNKNKSNANPKWPDYKGSCMVGGIEYFISGWAKTGDDGRKWMSLAFTAKPPKPEQVAPAQPEVNDDGGLPF